MIERKPIDTIIIKKIETALILMISVEAVI
jgi:hypothetical protein